jgi:hypothetical protein
MLFESIPQELIFCGPAPVLPVTPVTVQISIPNEEEVSFALTAKGVNNNIMASPTNSPRRRRRPTKKVVPAVTGKIARNS